MRENCELDGIRKIVLLAKCGPVRVIREDRIDPNGKCTGSVRCLIPGSNQVVEASTLEDLAGKLKSVFGLGSGCIFQALFLLLQLYACQFS